ncbi:hypothetical protein FGO68_gene5367 [Halteria grandinella]|uniref:Uncharacterized protein n=1 Tax=Halteria grandinella TaxID=5974 RepID=A0A8J8NFF0_HALGN|nr:hypothetical protein FGO68_gene5367 [Halteria grandinella]
MSAVLNTLGFMMLGIAVVIGYAGPANALNSIQAVVLTFLSIMLMNQIPTSNQVAGMMLGMVGTIIVSLGDTLFNAFSGCYREVRTLYNARVRRDDSFTSGDRFGGDYERLKN